MKPIVSEKSPKSILTPATGFLAGYSHSLNPYTGCMFGCSYCYVKGLPVSLFRGQEWGGWVDVKTGAADLLRKELARAKRRGKVTIFMSSSTDPYQPIEARARITRRIIEVLAEDPPDFLFVQTRSPLVVRDIDLFRSFRKRIRISMTIETNLESMRKAFTPQAPPLEQRFKALGILTREGFSTQAAVAPVLPFSDTFPDELKEVTDYVTLDDYFRGDGSGGKRTERFNIRSIYEAADLVQWYDPSYLSQIVDRFQKVFPEGHVRISREGFQPC